MHRLVILPLVDLCTEICHLNLLQHKVMGTNDNKAFKLQEDAVLRETVSAKDASEQGSDPAAAVLWLTSDLPGGRSEKREFPLQQGVCRSRKKQNYVKVMTLESNQRLLNILYLINALSIQTVVFIFTCQKHVFL